MELNYITRQFEKLFNILKFVRFAKHFNNGTGRYKLQTKENKTKQHFEYWTLFMA